MLKTNNVVKHNYNSLDLAKFICSIFVIAIHVPPFGYSNTNIASFLNFLVCNYLARLAVPFFFVCSGFLLYKKIAIDGKVYEHSVRYLKNIFRLYLIWSIIYFPLKIRGILEDEKGTIYAIIIYIRNSIFSGSYTHLWYLPALLLAVCLSSFLLCKNLSPKHILSISAFFYLIGLLAQSWFGVIANFNLVFPNLWIFLQSLEKIIITTRDGLFMGFFFVSVGMCFAYYGHKFNRKTSIIGFIFSMILLFAEIKVLSKLNYIRSYDYYMSTALTIYFLFSTIIQIDLQNSRIYMYLRKVSSLLYFLHLWIHKVVSKILEMMYLPLSNTSLSFAFTVLFSLIISVVLIEVSEMDRFKWIKKLYM